MGRGRNGGRNRRIERERERERWTEMGKYSQMDWLHTASGQLVSSLHCENTTLINVPIAKKSIHLELQCF